MSRPEVLISRQALVRNVELLRAQRPLKLFPVLKAYAYGHGAPLVAEVLEKSFGEDVLPLFCVARSNEAVELRKAGIERPILVLSQADGKDLPRLSNLQVVLHEGRDLETLPPPGAGLSGVHLNVNTGMNRLGFAQSSPTELVTELLTVSQRLQERGHRVTGFMSHLARAEEEPKLASAAQEKRFLEILQALRGAWREERHGPFPQWIHLDNSAGLARGLRLPQVNAARPGLHLYGLQQAGTPKIAGLEPVMRVQAPVRQVFWLEKGEGLGYGHRYVCPRRTLVGTVSLGYADGISRKLSRAAGEKFAVGFVVKGKKAPIIGTVSMDLTMIDLTDHPSVAGELVAEWIGPGQSADDIAQALGTISYEVLCAVGHRLPRRLGDDG